MASDPGLRFEAWTMPSSGTFVKRFDLSRAIEGYTLNDRYSDLSDGTLQISAAFAHANELIVVDRANHANDEGSVIRVLRGQTPVAHFVMRRIDRKWSSNLNVRPALLDGAEFFLDKQTVPNFDYPNVPMRNPDWIYGAESVFEGPGGEIAFEQQAIYRESTVTSGVFRLNFGGNQTPDLDWDSSASEINTALENLASIDQVTVDGTGAPFSPWVIEFIVPEGDVAQITISNSTLNGNMFVTTLRAGGSLDPRPWSPSFHPVTKLFHSTYTFFQMVEAPDPLYLDDTHSLAVDADTPPYPTDFGGAQVMVNVVGGGFYRAEIPIYSPTAQVVRFVIRDMNEGHIVSIEHTTAVNTWEVLEIEGIEIPIGVNQVIFRLGLITSGDPGIIYISPKYSLLAPGFKAAPLGKILGEILIFIQAQGDFLWVTKTFTDTTDSKGVAWDQDLSWGVQHGQTLLQLHEYANKWNYRWGFDWSVANSRWEWHAYNPGTTLTTVTNIGIAGHDGVIGSGTISTKIPEATHYQADGEGGEWGEFTDPVMPTIWGRLHKFYSNAQGMASTELTILAERLVDHASEYTEGLMVELQNPEYLPWEDYKKGDALTVVMTPEFPVGSIPIMAIVANKEVKRDPIYNVHLNSVVYEGEAAIAENLRRLIRAFKAEQFNQARGTVDPATVSGGGAGGMPTVVVAAYDSTEASKEKADFICTGVSDQVIIRQALESVALQWGRVQLTEGTFECEPDQSPMFALWNTLEGMGTQQTMMFINGLGTATGTAFELNNGAVLKGFYIASNHGSTFRMVSAESGRILVADMELIATVGTGYGIWASVGNDQSWFRDCNISANTGIYLNGGANLKISGMYMECEDYAIRDIAFGDNLVITDSYLLGDLSGVELTGATRVRMSNNYLLSANGDCIDITGGYGILTGNVFILAGDVGIDIHTVVAGATESWIINGNTVNQSGQHGIRLDGASDCVVDGNFINEAGIGVDNTYDGVHVVGTSNRNSIQNNRIRSSTDAGSNTRYGVNVTAGTNNVVNDNVIGPSGDFGTGVTNGTFQGTNFTV